MKFPLWPLVVVGTPIWVIACSEFEPVPRLASTSARDASAEASVVQPDSDASTGGPATSEGGAEGTPCHSCIENSCGSECRADDRCWHVYTCGAKLNCFEGKNQNQIIDCTRPCATEIGISNSEPAAVKLFFMLDCAFNKCGGTCHFT